MAEDRGGPGARHADAGSGAAGKRDWISSRSRPDREPLPTRVSGLPPLPAGYHAAIAAGMSPDASDLGESSRAALADHVRLVQAWNAAINLTSIRDPVAAAREHVLDSLAALPVLRSAGIDELLDLGSGAGFPGLPLAIALPAHRALLVESIGKKARFLEVVVAALGLEGTVDVAPIRGEELARSAKHRERWSCVVARAVARLDELAELSLPLLRAGGILVAWKRRPLDDELAEADEALPALGGALRHLVPVAVPGLEDHVLAVVEKRAPTPAMFPREPAARRRAPLGRADRRQARPLVR